MAQKRQQNFNFLNQHLASTNRLTWSLEKDQVPLCYPYLPKKEIHRRLLFDQALYFPQYWADVLNRGIAGFKWEKELSENMIALPLDQRYDLSDMEKIVEIIQTIRRGS